jgi:redox-sensitive bicupin YhaK (pirin superfamily)
MHITLQPGATLVIPKAKIETVNRSLFLVEGHDQGVLVDDIKQEEPVVLTLDSSKNVTLQLPEETSSRLCELLLLQGKPIGEPVARYGPFVMNTQAEIQAAFTDYGRTKFGGWPWPRDDMVFPREKGRFALMNGQESTPNDDDDTCRAQEHKED